MPIQVINLLLFGFKFAEAFEFEDCLLPLFFYTSMSVYGVNEKKYLAVEYFLTVFFFYGKESR